MVRSWISDEKLHRWLTTKLPCLILVFALGAFWARQGLIQTLEIHLDKLKMLDIQDHVLRRFWMTDNDPLSWNLRPCRVVAPLPIIQTLSHHITCSFNSHYMPAIIPMMPSFSHQFLFVKSLFFSVATSSPSQALRPLASGFLTQEQGQGSTNPQLSLRSTQE